MTTPQTLTRPLSQRALTLADPPPLPVHEADIPDAAIEAAAAALARGETHYTDRPGVGALRALIADDLNRRYDLGLKPSDITITCGATEARFAAIRLLAKAGSVIACPGDSSLIAGNVHLTGAILAQYADAPSLIYLTPADERAQIDALLAGAGESGAWVVWDESEQPGGDFHPAADVGLRSHVVTIGGLDDAMPGWRVGWMAGSEASERLRAFKQSMTICATSVSQWAAVEMMKQP